MPYWVISCKNCRRIFSHSKIEDTLANYFVPEKPGFADAGDPMACPHCHAIEKYGCTDLKYQVKLDCFSAYIGALQHLLLPRGKPSFPPIRRAYQRTAR